MDPDQDDVGPTNSLWQAVGWVAFCSNNASWALQELVSEITDSELVWSLLDKITTGQQLAAARKSINTCPDRPWVPDRTRDIELHGIAQGLLRMHEQLNQYRNRIIHNFWIVSPTAQRPDRVIGSRATRYSDNWTRSTCGTFHEVGRLLSLAAVGLQGTATSIHALRTSNSTSLESRRDNPLADARRTYRTIESRLSALVNGSPVWLWLTAGDDNASPDPDLPGPPDTTDLTDPRNNVFHSSEPIEF